MITGDLLFDLRIDHLDGHAVVALVGELDLCTAPRLHGCLTELVDLAQGHVVLDLSELTFLDSTGINEIVRAHQRACELGGGVVVRSPRRSVYKALDICGVTRMLRVDPAAE